VAVFIEKTPVPVLPVPESHGS